MTGGQRAALSRLVGSELVDLACDQSAWSQATFGADHVRGPIGALRHLQKEAAEAAEAVERIENATEDGQRRGACLDAREELADCLLLLLDASRRAGLTPLDLIRAARDKMVINKGRKWPPSVDGRPCEHVHDGCHTGGGPVG